MTERVPKTSLTHPLPLAQVKIPDGTGCIIFTMCPGKVQPNADTGPWDRDLNMDMDALAAGQAVRLVTLMEAHEIEACALSPEILQTACASRNITWHHSPIKDFNVPDQTWEKSWETLGSDLRRDLKAGKTIALHCRGGRGRAGLVAARLLIEFGAAPDAAITEVRTQRPKAIETKIQEEHLRGIRQLTSA
jgi:ADP-ribosyl-[dinitrogen reductase] hydrolase